MTVHGIPVVDFTDFSNRYEEIAEQVLDACKNIGFFHIINASTPSSAEVNRAFELVKDHPIFLLYLITWIIKKMLV